MLKLSFVLLALTLFAPTADAYGQTKSELSQSQQAFLQIASNENPIELNVVLDRAERKYAVGDPVTINVTPMEDAFLNVFSIDREGKVTLLYPNDYAPAALAVGGKRREFPEAAERWGIVADREGAELIKVIASKSPQPLAAKAAFDQAGPFRVYKATGSTFARQLGSDGDAVSSSRWGHASVTMIVGSSINSDGPPPPLSEAELAPLTGPLDGIANKLPRRPKIEPSLY